MTSLFTHVAFVSLAIVFLSTTPVQAGCSPCQENCQSQQGTLNQLKNLFTQGTGVDSGPGEARNDLNAYKYGKYCGASNFCNANEQSPQGTPCNPIDAACQAHDGCYGNDSNELGELEKCECDANFLLSLVGGLATFGGGSCDASSGDELCDSTACPYEESGLAIIFFFCQVFEEEGCAAKFDSNPTILGAASVCSAPVYPQCLEVFLPPAP